MEAAALNAMAVMTCKAFSLLELMIATFMISVLTVLAIPAYDEYRTRAERTEVVRELLALASCQAQLRASRGSYDTTACLPGNASEVYDFSVTPVGESRVFEFQYSAKPRKPDVDDRCGTFSIDHLGRRAITGTGEITLECWGGR